ncbi:hypothetical protein [Anoxybacillus flavithermus]|nr:hypothetical protein [Anoxybacillus flavithermus]
MMKVVSILMRRRYNNHKIEVDKNAGVADLAKEIEASLHKKEPQ